MDLTVVGLLAGLAVVIVLLIMLLVQGRRRSDQSTDQLGPALESLKAELVQKQMEGLISLRQSLDSAQQLLNDRLAEGTGALDRRMELFGQIENRLGELAQQTKNIETVGANIQSLSELLRPPQLRGALGEILLENLLAQILPTSLYDTQVTLADGKRVDAVVKLADRLLPIDSKFPLDQFPGNTDDPDAAGNLKAFRRSLKQHIDAISSKYVRPDEGTTEVAVMYIPSEAVYHRLVSMEDPDGLSYALSKRVIPSCPGHLYAFLASLAAVYTEAGLAGSSRDLVSGLNDLHASLSKLQEAHQRMDGSMRRLGTSMTRANEALGDSLKRVDQLRRPE